MVVQNHLGQASYLEQLVAENYRNVKPNRLQNLPYGEAFSASAEACPCAGVHAGGRSKLVVQNNLGQNLGQASVPVQWMCHRSCSVGGSGPNWNVEPNWLQNLGRASVPVQSMCHQNGHLEQLVAENHPDVERLSVRVWWW